MPPQTPNSTRLSRASARHSVRTTHPKQRVLARFCAAPRTNSSSGSTSRQAARVVQSALAVPAYRSLFCEKCVMAISSDFSCGDTPKVSGFLSRWTQQLHETGQIGSLLHFIVALLGCPQQRKRPTTWVPHAL